MSSFRKITSFGKPVEAEDKASLLVTVSLVRKPETELLGWQEMALL